MQTTDMPSISATGAGENPDKLPSTPASSASRQEPPIRLSATDLTDSYRVMPVRTAEASPDSESVHSFSQVAGIESDNKLFEHTIFGPWKRWSRFKDNWERVFLIAVIIALTVSLLMTFIKFIQGELDAADSTYGLILITATVFSYIYVVTGVYQEKPYNMLALVITNLIVWGYVLINFINFKRHENKVHVGKLVRLVFTTIFTVFLVPMACHLAWQYHSRKSLITYSVGSVNSEAKKMASRHFLFTSGIAFDLQLQVNFLILVLHDGVTAAKTEEWVILGVGAVLTIAWFILGLFAVRKESNILLLLFVILIFPNLAYAVVKFYSLSTYTFDQIFTLTILSGVSAVIVRIGILVLTYYVYLDFGKQLKELIYGYDAPSSTGREGRRPTVAIPGSNEEAETPEVRVHRPLPSRTDSL